jgi:hypothetical protein
VVTSTECSSSNTPDVQEKYRPAATLFSRTRLSKEGEGGEWNARRRQEGIFSYISPEKRIPTDHPLRPIRKMVDEILREMSPQFAKLYSSVGASVDRAGAAVAVAVVADLLRLLNEEIAEGFFRRVIERAKPFMSDEHFTVDGTLIEAWASQKSFRRKDGKGKPPGAGGDVDFHGEKGEKRKNERMNPQPIPMHGCSRNPKGARRS